MYLFSIEMFKKGKLPMITVVSNPQTKDKDHEKFKERRSSTFGN
jgi:hypothetical protein